MHDFEFLRYLPDDYETEPQRQWPLLVFLHGAGERGRDLEMLKRHGIPKELEQGRKLPFVVVSPQCPPDERWNIFALEALIERVKREHRIDPDRIYLTGLSMGGFGVWGLALRHPERYAAVIPVCGGGESRYAAALRDLPVWAFHGDSDQIVPLQRTQEMIDAIQAAGGSPRFTVYPDVKHDSWSATYANPEIYDWLLSHRRRVAASPPRRQNKAGKRDEQQGDEARQREGKRAATSTNTIGSSSNPMTARELNHWLRSLYQVPEPSVDRVIVGDPETVVRGIAVAWMPTWDALREAEAKGCNVFVAHEPTFFSHHDLYGFEEAAGRLSPAALKAMSGTRDAKRRWIEEHGMVVIRCHDVLDLMPGGVADALAQKLGFTDADVLANEPYYRVLRVAPAMRAAELAQRLADSFGVLGQPGVAFYGDGDRVVHRLGLGTGYACEPWKFVELGAVMCVTIDDRIKTWTETEWADDAGFPMVVIHHGTSEEWGVWRLHELIAQKFPGTAVQLLPQGFRARWIAPASGSR